MSSAKWRPFCPGGDELAITHHEKLGYITNEHEYAISTNDV